MRPPSPSTEDPDRGSAAVEFILLGLLLLIPLVYLVVSLGQIQEQSLGAEAGARHIARAVATAVDTTDASVRADEVLASVVQEYGLDADETSISLACRPASAGCPAPGATLVVTVRTSAALPLVPPIFGLDRTASIPIEASTAQRVSRFWGSG